MTIVVPTIRLTFPSPRGVSSYWTSPLLRLKAAWPSSLLPYSSGGMPMDAGHAPSSSSAQAPQGSATSHNTSSARTAEREFRDGHSMKSSFSSASRPSISRGGRGICIGRGSLPLLVILSLRVGWMGRGCSWYVLPTFPLVDCFNIDLFLWKASSSPISRRGPMSPYGH